MSSTHYKSAAYSRCPSAKKAKQSKYTDRPLSVTCSYCLRRAKRDFPAQVARAYGTEHRIRGVDAALEMAEHINEMHEMGYIVAHTFTITGAMVVVYRLYLP